MTFYLNLKLLCWILSKKISNFFIINLNIRDPYIKYCVFILLSFFAFKYMDYWAGNQAWKIITTINCMDTCINCQQTVSINYNENCTINVIIQIHYQSTYMIWILLHCKRFPWPCLTIGKHGRIVTFQETLELYIINLKKTLNKKTRLWHFTQNVRSWNWHFLLSTNY